MTIPAAPIPAWIRDMTLVSAPMALLSHSAFRRLVAEAGGCDLITTEMLAGGATLNEDPRQSPFLRRVPGDGAVAYQLLLREPGRIAAIVERLSACDPAAIDVNCACPAAVICQSGGGIGLFEDASRLATILRELRKAWPGRITVKIRFGRTARPDWRERLVERLRVIEDCGVNGITVHPRFGEDRLTRPAKLELLPWFRTLTPLPLVANGDIAGPETVAAHPAWFADYQGVMLGRLAIAQPWCFQVWKHPETAANFAAGALWQRLTALINEEFPPEKKLGRLKLYANWYSRNFLFGREFYNRVRNSPTWEYAEEAAATFFAAGGDLAPLLNLSDI